jgi:arylsulfatase A-like enzyme
MATHRGHHCLRDGEWKYIRGEDRQHELYHLAEDPEERHNVFGQHPEVEQRLERHFLEAWMDGGALV